MACAYDYTTLIAIDATYKKWAETLELWVSLDHEGAHDASWECCPLCVHAYHRCPDCIVYVEIGNCCDYEPLDNIHKGVCGTGDFEAILSELDRIWEAVRGGIE